MADIFFSEKYGKLWERIEHGVCETFRFSYDGSTVQNMFIRRETPWEIDGERYFDVITPYGYGGPILVAGDCSKPLITKYYAAWSEYCRQNNIIAEFVRYHLFDNTAFRAAFPGEILHVSDNVVRSLDVPMDEMKMQFAHKVRKNVKRATECGLTVASEESGAHLSDFLEIYNHTMERNNARAYYYFDREFFEDVINNLPGHFRFFHVMHEEKIISTELVLCSEKYVYSFLGGTLEESYPMRPNELLKCEIIKWSQETGHSAFILGGGYGGNDGIYRYKKSFAPGSDVPFYVGRFVHNQEIYDKLVDMRRQQGELNSNFFPLYRA